MSPVQAQNPDGSWGEVAPLGWQPGLDVEVYRDGRRWRAEVFDEDVCVANVRARTRFGLSRRIRRAIRQVSSTPTEETR